MHINMQEITYNTYLEALEIVRRFHQQILGTDVSISNAHNEVEEKMLMNSGTGLLLDFLIDHWIPTRVYTSIVRNFPKKKGLGEWTVEYFLSIYLVEVQYYRNLGWMKGVSAKTMTDFLMILSQNGYHDYVKPFEEYYVKK